MQAHETGAAHNTSSSEAARHGKPRQKWITWFRPVGKAIVAIAVVAGLTWMGAKAAASSPAPSAVLTSPDASAVIVAASSASANAPEKAAETTSAVRTSRGLLADGRVVLNAADETELCQLPRVGPAKAKRILVLRGKMGRFRSPRDLLRVKGIGAKTLQQMMPKLVLDDPEGGAKGGN